MPQPILYQTAAFDASSAHEFQFTYSGDQAYRNRLVVRNNASNAVIYDKTLTTFQLRHLLPAASLTNGNGYNAQVQVLHQDGSSSALSNKIVFYCFTAPVFSFSSPEPEQMIHNSAFEAALSYTQPEGELLSAYKFSLCDSRHAEIYSTDLLYDQTLRTTLSGLIDNYHYYLRGTGVTVHGMEVDTGFVPFSVEYIRPSMFAVLNLENLWHEGCVLIQSNIVSIEGTSNPDPPKYIDGEWVDLSDPEHWVRFDQGFSIADDFTLQLAGRDFNENSTLLEMSNQKDKIEIRFYHGSFAGYGEVAYFVLMAHNGTETYIVTSDYIPIPSPDEVIPIWVRRVGPLYEIRVKGPDTGSCFAGEGLAGYRGYLLSGGLLLRDSILHI